MEVMNKNTAEKMVRVRNLYCNSINNISVKFASLEKTYNLNNFSPSITTSTKEVFENKLFLLRKQCTNKIILELKTHLYNSASNPGIELSKKIKRFSKKVLEVLEDSYKNDKYPSDIEKLRLAEICLISTKQVSNWFTNKRNRSKGEKYGHFYN
ncbi:hypothetical protein NUSPORA_02207 [Nucleospora cyclopteri]